VETTLSLFTSSGASDVVEESVVVRDHLTGAVRRRRNKKPHTKEPLKAASGVR
jgi:hypothetical protein